MKKYTFIGLFLLVLCALPAAATVRLPRLTASGMVLQRDAPLHIWGWASPEERVTVAFTGKTYRTRADKNGDWVIELPAQSAGGPYTMQINDITLTDILIGDVWLCAGQSNMELPVSRVSDRYGAQMDTVCNPQIRQFKVPMHYDFAGEDDDLPGGEWRAVTPENVLDFSAVAYFFAGELYDKYRVPIGIINASVGGSPIEAWMSREALKNYPHYLQAADLCAGTNYIDSVQTAETRRDSAWYATLNQKDAGTGVWNRADFDNVGRAGISLPGYWADKGLGVSAGSVWFRKDFEVEAAMAGQAATLRLGVIVDADSAFINGHFVGTTSYRYPPRIYPIPAGILKAGRNNITVRVVSHANEGGFVTGKSYKIIVGTDEIDLTGDWKYRIGAEMPPLDGQTFFQYKPIGLYNGMIAPLKDYALKGVVWYQGESNTDRAGEYRNLLTGLIGNWRALWHNAGLPFIYAQLPNFGAVCKQPGESNWADLREAQRQVQRLPATGMAVTIDAGEANDIHPLDKKTVGHRLFLAAERVAYGEWRPVSSGPVCESVQKADSSLILTFSSIGKGLCTNLDLEGFAIAGADKHYAWAKAAVLYDNRIRVWNDRITDPRFVRYAWADNPAGANLRNKAGLPASPFEAALSDTITGNQTGLHNGYDYELWRDSGDVRMSLKTDGAFACSWRNIHNALFRIGKKFDDMPACDRLADLKLTYGCDYRPVGNSYLCVYGWSLDPLIEFYIVEAWGEWRPPGAKSLGSVEIDGGKYDIYETTRVDKPSIVGDTTFRQFWSVRTRRKTGGTVSVGAHFKAWEKLGLKPGRITEVALCVEGYESSGTADLYEFKMEN